MSHFHADHCFGWPFLLQALAEVGGGKTVHVVGPPGIEAHLASSTRRERWGPSPTWPTTGSTCASSRSTATWQEAGPLRFRAVEVVHVPYLRCFGYLFERSGAGDGAGGGGQAQVVGYSGDVTPCAGLTELAREADVLVVECNGRHTPPGVPTAHMDEEAVRALAEAHPDTHLILTHLGEQVDTASLAGAGVTVPDDFERLTV